jgi:tripartite-type tricarboxylate transporter receptor subunit TctC
VQKHFARSNLQAVGGTPAEAKAFIQKETVLWGKVIKDAKVPAH